MIGAKRARLWVNAGLAIIVIGLAFWAYFAQKNIGESADPLTNVARAEVERIVLRPIVGEAIEIKRAEHGWNVVAPIQAPADASAVDALLGVLDAAALSRYPERSLKLSEVGLAPPQLWLDFSGVRIALGAVNPLNFRRYVMYEGRVALTQDRYAEFLESAPIDYASRSPLPYPDRLTRLEVPGFHLSRDDEGKWQQSDAIKDQQAVASLVNAWKQAIAVAMSQTTETEALSEAVLGFAGGEEIRLLVIARDPELVLARPDLGLAYHLDASAVAQLFPPASTLPEPEPQTEPQAEPQAEPNPPAAAEPADKAVPAESPVKSDASDKAKSAGPETTDDSTGSADDAQTGTKDAKPDDAPKGQD